MDTKSRPLERLKKAIYQLKLDHKNNGKLTNEEIRKKLEFSSKSYLSNLLHGHAPINDKFLELLEEKLEISAHWIRTGEGPMLVKKPKLSVEERLYKLYEQKPRDLIKLIAFLFHRVASLESHYYGQPFHDQVEELVSAAEEFSWPENQ